MHEGEGGRGEDGSRRRHMEVVGVGEREGNIEGMGSDEGQEDVDEE